MVHLSTTTFRHGGVTLVECRLGSERPCRVRVTNRLDGPVWPPRRRGVPAAGWDEDGVTVTVAGVVGLGYATPAPPVDPPATIAGVDESTVATGAEPSEDGFATEFDVSPTADGVVRSLSDPRPPRRAVPTGDPRRTDGTSRGDDTSRDDGTSREDDESSCAVPRNDHPIVADTEPTGQAGLREGDVAPTTEGTSSGDDGQLGGRLPDGRLPDGRLPDTRLPEDRPPGGRLSDRSESPAVTGAIDADDRAGDPVPPDVWLGAVERRIELLEGVAAASTLPAATTAVSAAGGLDGVADLVATVEADRTALLTVARRAEELAGRAAATEPDVATLRRLA